MQLIKKNFVYLHKTNQMSKQEKLQQLQALVDELGLKTANKVKKENSIPYYRVMIMEGITIDGIRYVVTK